MNITEFKRGDTITRMQESLDGSNDFQHTRVRFISVTGSVIHLLSPYGIVHLGADNWSEGWEYYKEKKAEYVCYDDIDYQLSDVEKISFTVKTISAKKDSLKHYESKLTEAIENEQYEQCAMLRDKIASKKKEIDCLESND